MTDAEFNHFMRSHMRMTQVGWCDTDPCFAIRCGDVVLAHRDGHPVELSGLPTRVLRALALQLQMVADEQDRRACEDEP